MIATLFTVVVGNYLAWLVIDYIQDWLEMAVPDR